MTLIFDFDGTLIDSFECIVKLFGGLAHEFNLPTLSSTEIEQLRDLTSRDIIKYFNIPLYKLPRMIHRIRKNMKAEILHLKPVEHLPEVLETLYYAGFHMGILTSNSRDNVKDWLAHNKLDPYFKFVRATSNFFSKKTNLESIIKRYQIERQLAIYVGDETRDIQAAQGACIKSMAVTWGYNSKKILLKQKPTYLVQQPNDILKILWPA